MKIAVSSYSFQQYINAGKMTQLDVVQRVAEMGFAGIDFTDLKPNSNPTLEQQLAYAAEIRKEAEKYGVEIVAYTIGANLYHDSQEDNANEVTRLRGQVDVAAALGATLLRHDVCYSEVHNGRTVSFGKMLPTIAMNAYDLTCYAESRGIRTMTENHGYIAQDCDRVEALYNTVNHDNYGLLIDVGNFACADEDSLKAVSRLAPYAFHVHVKDFRIHPFGYAPREGEKIFSSRACRVLSGCAIGDGDIPVEQCIAILKRAKYDGYLTIEYEGSEDCLSGISRGLENLKKYIG